MNHTMHVTLPVEADTERDAYDVAAGACEHLEETFNDNGSISAMVAPPDPSSAPAMRALLQRFIDWEASDEPDGAELQKLIEHAAALLEHGDAVLPVGDGTVPSTELQRDTASDLHCHGDIEIDDDARISVAEDGSGYWVQAWVWVGTPQAADAIELTITVPDQTCYDTMTTAVGSPSESCIRRWCDIVSSATRIRDDTDIPDILSFEADIIDGPVQCDHPDIEAAEIGRFTCDPDMVRAGIRRLLAPGAEVSPAIRNDALVMANDPEHLCAAMTADAIVQFGVFGELVFG